MSTPSPYPLVSRERHPHGTVVSIGDAPLGGERFIVIAGPCAIEGEAQLDATAMAVKEAGAACLRGGAFKSRTSPYAFQGLGTAGLEILADVSRRRGLPTVTEVVDAADIESVARHADALQVGSRNMQNFRLLGALGACDRPVLLKRGFASELRELLLAAEYIVCAGNPRVILCERGIKTFETATRNTLDLSAVPYLKRETHLPVIVDPSHATGIRELVPPMAFAAAACGADGLLVEVHPDPPAALSDGPQSLDFAQFRELMRALRPFLGAAGRSL